MTPIRADKLRVLLNEANYNQTETEFLYHGFVNGFSLQYSGNRKVKRLAPNLKFHVGNSTVLWNKIMKEVKLKHFAGPYTEIPFQYYIQSTVGLVSKDHNNDTRLIFHLSYPRVGTTSVNANTPDELCTINTQNSIRP